MAEKRKKEDATRMASLHELAAFFAVLGDPCRLRIMHELKANGPGTVNEIATRTGVAQSNASRQLKALHGAGFVARETEGVRVRYGMADATLCQLCELAGSKLRARAERLSSAARKGGF